MKVIECLLEALYDCGLVHGQFRLTLPDLMRNRGEVLSEVGIKFVSYRRFRQPNNNKFNSPTSGVLLRDSEVKLHVP